MTDDFEKSAKGVDIKLQDAALHEAGHAVMHVFLALENLDSVDIVPGEVRHAGRMVKISGTVSARKFAFSFVKYPGPRGFLARIECRKHLLAAWAGPESGLLEARLTFTDLAIARKCANTVAPRRVRSLIACYQLRARGIIKRRLLPAIEAFAQILIERKRIEGVEAEEIISGLLGVEVGHGWNKARMARTAERYRKWEAAIAANQSKQALPKRSRKPAFAAAKKK